MSTTRTLSRFATLALVAALPTTGALGEALLSSGDFIIAIDHSLNPSSNYPVGEPPSAAIDGDDFTKYLNFGGSGTGFIVTPGSSVIQSMSLVTGNDAPGRDPFTFELYGTNDAITSTDNSLGNLENWNLISSGGLTPPADRNTAYPTVDFANGVSFSSYRLIFPTLSGSPDETLMQISEVQFYTGLGASGSAVLNFNDPIIAIDTITTLSPLAESAANVLDGDTSTKWLSFGQDGSGVIVTPSGGPSTVVAMQLGTANDFAVRDPTSFEIYGTNDAITSSENSEGSNENWVLIDSGSIALQIDREVLGDVILIDNDTEYTSYKIVFPTVVDNSGTFPANSLQISELQLFDSVPIPEPGSLALLGLGGLAVLRRRR